MSILSTTLSIAAPALVIGALWIASRNRPVRSRDGAPLKASNTQDASSRELRIGVYNIYTGKGMDRRRDLARTADVLRDVEVASLHEVKAGFLGWPDQATAIANYTGHVALFSPSRRRWFRDYRGNAMISTRDLGGWGSQILPGDNAREFRNLTTTTVSMGGAPVTLMFTHLNTRAPRRDEQLRKVLDNFDAATIPAILLGDLNIRPDHELMIDYLEQHPYVVDAIAHVLHDRDPHDRVDWILAKGFDVVSGDMVGVGASDHPFYHASLRLN